MPSQAERARRQKRHAVEREKERPQKKQGLHLLGTPTPTVCARACSRSGLTRYNTGHATVVAARNRPRYRYVPEARSGEAHLRGTLMKDRSGLSMQLMCHGQWDNGTLFVLLPLCGEDFAGAIYIFKLKQRRKSCGKSGKGPTVYSLGVTSANRPLSSHLETVHYERTG